MSLFAAFYLIVFSGILTAFVNPFRAKTPGGPPGRKTRTQKKVKVKGEIAGIKLTGPTDWSKVESHNKSVLKVFRY